MSLADLFPATRRSVRNTRDDVVATRADISELRQRIDTLQEQNALLLKRLESTYNRVVQTDCGINERLTTEFNNTWDRIDTNAAHNTIRFHALYARDGEEHAKPDAASSLLWNLHRGMLDSSSCAALD